MTGVRGWLLVWLHALLHLHQRCWIRTTCVDASGKMRLLPRYHYCTCGYGTDVLPPDLRQSAKAYDNDLPLRDPEVA